MAENASLIEAETTTSEQHNMSSGSSLFGESPDKPGTGGGGQTPSPEEPSPSSRRRSSRGRHEKLPFEYRPTVAVSPPTQKKRATPVEREPRWVPGDMLWAKVSGHPWWPCLVALDPQQAGYHRTNAREFTLRMILLSQRVFVFW